MILQPDHICIDYSFARPAPRAIVAAGVKTVVRYISPTRTNRKNLTIAERDALHADGLGILLVWENGATDPLAGAPLGAAHGQMARKFARDLDYPADIEIIVAVDFDVQPQLMAPVLAYLSAFKEATRWPQGTYGKDTVITAAHDAGVSTLGWQTVAWSKGKRSPHAHVLQHARLVHPAVATLGAVDDNTVLRQFKAWSALPDPAPPPPPPPDPPQEVDMPHVIFELQDADAALIGTADKPGGLVIDVEWGGPGGDAWDAKRALMVAFGAELRKASVGNFGHANLHGDLPTGDTRHTWSGDEFYNAAEIKARNAPVAAEDEVARQGVAFLHAENEARADRDDKLRDAQLAAWSG